MKLHYSRYWAAAALVTVSLVAIAQKKPPFYLKPDQTIDIESGKFVIASQNCESWALAAGLEAMLKQQDVSLD